MRTQLPASLTIATVDVLLTTLLEVVASPEPLELDASEVAQIDTAGVQVLCAVIKQRQRLGLELRWVGRQTIDPMIAVAGLQHEFTKEEA